MKLKINIKHKVQLYLTVLTTSVLTLMGCEREEFNHKPSSEAEMIECGVNMGIELPTIIGDQTKSNGLTSEGLVDEETTIKNVWILQYDENSTFIGSATYIEDLSPYAFDEEYHIPSVNLLSSNDKTHSIVFVANTFDDQLFTDSNRSNFSTITLLKKFNYSITTDNQDGSYTDNFGLSKDSNGKQYLIMSDIVEAVVKTEDITCNLEYNLAKVDIELINNNNDYTPISIQMRAVPAVATYVTGYSLPATYPSKNSFKPTDYNSVDITDLSVKNNFMFYMPANVRGVVSDNQLAENKPVYADNYNTYIEVIAQKNDNSGDEVAYAFYLGENLTNNFNIKPNHKYKYTLTIDNFNDETILADSRIKFTNENIFDYTLERPSNCYILNPSQTSDRVYYIPIAKRINEFWGGNGYESVSENVINEGDIDYDVTLGWHDYRNDELKSASSTPPFSEMSLSDIENKVTFDAISTAPSGLTSMKVVLKQNATEGNVSVNIVREGRVLWSWHFWITDYNPNSTARYKNKYAMTVDGGEIHSYTGSDWEGTYAGHFMMDRDLGAKNNNDGTLSLFYQFGRKDPFRVYGQSGWYGYYNVVQSKPMSMKELVENPTNFYSYNSDIERVVFPKDGKYNNMNLVWCDPKITINKYGLNKKSIFDPSPLGWMVPTPAVWNDFKNTDKSIYIYPSNNNITQKRGGRFYNPEATTLSPASYDNYVAYYPINGTLLSYAGAFSYGSGYDWSSQAVNTGYSYMMLFRTHEEISAYFSYFRWNGRAVRPVTE